MSVLNKTQRQTQFKEEEDYNPISQILGHSAKTVIKSAKFMTTTQEQQLLQQQCSRQLIQSGL
jgi:hypothetical protein